MYVPAPLSTEAILFTGFGLIAVIAGLMLYDHHHEIILHPHSLEIRIRPLNQVDEYHLREIADVTVRERWLAPADVIVHLEDGAKVKLRHVDQAHQVRSYLLGKL